MSKKFFQLLIAIFIFLNITAIANAGNILYYVDETKGTDQMLAALNYYATSGIHTYTITSNATYFASEIATDNYDLGIANVQSFDPTLNSDVASALTALADFVEDGGLSIYTDWSRNDYYGAAFGVQYVSDETYSNYDANLKTDDPSYKDYSDVDMTTSQFALDVSDTVSFTDQGWNNSSFALTAINGAVEDATFTDADGTYAAIVVGKDGSSITNGFLNDIYDGDDEDDAKQLYVNEIGYLLPPAVPEPSTLLLFGTGLVGFFVRRRK